MNVSGYQDLLNRSIIDADSIIIGTLILPNLDPNSIPYIDSDNTVQDRILNNGQLVVGVKAGAPVAASLTGTANQVSVTNGAGSITLSTPQDIATTSSPTFNNISLTSINTVPVSNYIITPSTSDLNMNTHAISNVTSLNGTLVSNYLKTPSTVDLDMNNHHISNFNSLRPINTNVNIGNTKSLTAVGSGQIVIGDFTTSTGSSNVCIGLSNIARNLGVAIGKETVCGIGGVSVGYRSQTNQTDVIHIGRDNFSNALGADIFGVSQTSSQANSLLLGNGSYTNIRAPGSVCNLGTSLVPFQTLFSNGSISGTVNTRLTNDIVSNTGTGTLNNIVVFTSDKIIKDSTIPISAISGYPYLPLAGGTMAGAIAMGTKSITNVGSLSGAVHVQLII